jgi:hypothetical protein
MKIIYLLIATIFFIISCDVIEEPYSEDGGGVVVSEDTIYRNVVILELTGIHCANCPKASKEGQRIMDENQGRVFGINAHGLPGFSNPKSPTQPYFIVKAATDIYTKTGDNQLPVGYINYFGNTNVRTNDATSWDFTAREFLQTPADMDLKISVESTGESEFILNTNIVYVNPQSESEKLVAYLVENNIVGFQLDGTEEVEDYIHNHVLRDDIIPLTGENLFASVSAGDSLQTSYEFSVTNPEWVKSNMKVIAFIFNSENEEILQAAEADLLIAE